MESIIQQKFTSSKVFDGYSTTFRQWRAEGTHCKFLHGYGVSLQVWFEGDLDEGELEIGQVAGLIHEIKPAKDIIDEILEEFESTKKLFC